MAETVLVVPLYGPYAGQRLTLSEADAKAAIKDGIARDPFAPAEEAKEITAEDRQKLLAKAAEAAARWRGETAAATETRAMEAEDDAGEYQTRSAAKSKK